MAKRNYQVGEKEIEDILIDLKEFYSTKTKLHLKKDDKKYRIPDFYLHKYNLAIEYFGTWDYPKSLSLQRINRKKFIKKIDAYNANDINCVFIYPNELESACDIIRGAILEIKNGHKPLAWVLPWMHEDKIDPPRAEDFKSKYEPLDWVIPWLHEKKIEEPRAEDFEERIPPLKWNLPWLNEKKIEEPKAEDFLGKVKEKIKKKPKNKRSHAKDDLDIKLEDPNMPNYTPSKEKKSFDMEEIIPIIGFVLIALIVILILLFLIAILFFPK
jgi:hypothetical protein